MTKKRPTKIKAGDRCPDCKANPLVITLTCKDNDCGATFNPADGYQIELIKDEGDLCDLILRHAHLLTCINCGAKLPNKVRSDNKVGVLYIDLAAAYFECAECSEAHLPGFLRYRLKKGEKKEHVS